MNIQLTYLWLQWFFVTTAFVFSISTQKKKDNFPYMKGIYLYSLIAFILLTIALSNAYFILMSKESYILLHKLSFIIHFSLLGYFFLQLFTDFKYNFLIKILYATMMLIIIFIFLMDFKKSDSKLISITTNTFLVVFCIIYYISLFIKISLEELTESPSFWIVNGVFIAMSSSITGIALQGILPKNLSIETNNILTSVASISYCLLNLFFIKAYLCSAKIKV